MKEKSNKITAYICSVCGEIFTVEGLGHCPECAHHYPAGFECSNCHHHIIRKTMTKTKINESEFN